jgi:hypothetical protein
LIFVANHHFEAHPFSTNNTCHKTNLMSLQNIVLTQRQIMIMPNQTIFVLTKKEEDKRI